MVWTWVQPGRVHFTYPAGWASATVATRRAFRRLCGVMLTNYPHLLHRPVERGLIRPYDQTKMQHHSWEMQDPDMIIHYDSTIKTNVRPATTMAAVEQAVAADLHEQMAVAVHAHPDFTRLVRTWAGTKRWRPMRKLYKAEASKRRRLLGERARTAAEHREGSLDPVTAAMHEGLGLLRWTDTQRCPGLNASTSQFLLRLKAKKLNRWNTGTQALRCPFDECDPKNSSSYEHIFWRCPNAQLRWVDLQYRWARLGTTTTQDLAIHIFGHQLPSLPIATTTIIPPEDAPMLDLLPGMARLRWRNECAVTLMDIWNHRRAVANGCSAHRQVIQQRQAGALGQARHLLSKLISIHVDPDEAKASQSLMNYFDELLGPREMTPTLTPVTLTSHYLLLFDGGSRGNPGPGGSGSIIVRLCSDHRPPQVIWVASMSYAGPKTTNNEAEYQGLLHGLRRARHCRWTPLHVIGDSAMIISQHKAWRSPKHKRLRPLYTLTSRLAMQLPMESWTHHFRSYNKMADLAANWAMDSKSSTQYQVTNRQPNDTARMDKHQREHLAADLLRLDRQLVKIYKPGEPPAGG